MVVNKVKELVDRPSPLIGGALVRVQPGLPNVSSLSQRYQPAIQRYQPEAQRYQLVKDQPAKRGPAGLFISFPTIGQLYNIITDDADETVVGPLTLRDTIAPNNANENKKLSLAAHQRCRNGGRCTMDAKKVKELVDRLSPRSQQLMLTMAEELAQNEGISLSSDHPNTFTDLAAAVPLWEDDLSSREYSDRTIQTYSYWVKRILAAVAEPTYLSLTHYLAEQRKREITANTRKIMTKALKSFFGFLSDQGLIRQNPTQKLRHPKVDRTVPVYPEKEEVGRMLTAIGQSNLLDEKDKLKVALLILVPGGTGVRFNELAKLSWNNINFDRQEFKVMGKGRKERIIPLLPQIAGLLSAWKEYSPGELVFPTNSKHGRIDPADTNRMLKRLAKRAGVRPFSIHKLRHYFATYALAAGADLKQISEILGHASIAITGDIYRHLLTGEISKTMARFSPMAGITPALPKGKGGESGEDS